MHNGILWDNRGKFWIRIRILFKKKWYKQTYLQNRKRLLEIEFMVAEGKVAGKG